MKETQDSKRDEALGRALQQIEKAYGKGAIMQLDKMDADVEGISTGALSLDLALGGKGLPRGRIVELFGPEASGKTTLALSVAAAAQRAGGVAAIVDAEHALNPGWARKCGVNLEKLLVSQPEAGEEALEITEMLVRSGSVDVIIIDSVAALIPRAEIEGEMGDTHVALQARLMSQALRKLTAAIGKAETIVIFINQIRMKIGVMFGNPETQRWECPECGASEMTDGEVARLLVACSELLKSKMIDIGIVMEAPVTEPVEETWSQALKNKFKQ